MPTINPKQFEYIRPTSWQEIFSSWKENEVHQERWIEHYKSRGFDSWEDWRNSGVAPLKPNERKWFLYRIVDPLKIVPDFWGGPFQSWKKEHYGDKETLTFAQLTALPSIAANKAIHEIANSFPPPLRLSASCNMIKSLLLKACTAAVR